MSETLELKAGRELDALIAEKVLGHIWKRGIIVGGGYGTGDEGEGWGLPDYSWVNPETGAYSTEIEAARSVVEKLGKRGLCVRLFREPQGCGRPLYRAEFWRYAGDATAYWAAEADSAPLAICIAALKALAP